MICKKCAGEVAGKGPDMARHLRNECPGRIDPLAPGVPVKGKGKVKKKRKLLIDPVAMIDGLDAAAIRAEIDLLNRRRAALSELLRVAEARDGATTPPGDPEAQAAHVILPTAAAAAATTKTQY